MKGLKIRDESLSPEEELQGRWIRRREEIEKRRTRTTKATSYIGVERNIIRPDRNKNRYIHSVAPGTEVNVRTLQNNSIAQEPSVSFRRIKRTDVKPRLDRLRIEHRARITALSYLECTVVFKLAYAVFITVFSRHSYPERLYRRASEPLSKPHPHASSLGQGRRVPSRTFSENQLLSYWN